MVKVFNMSIRVFPPIKEIFINWGVDFFRLFVLVINRLFRVKKSKKQKIVCDALFLCGFAIKIILKIIF